ncbi:signal peptidase I [Rarobacter incanus]|uniref:Signal peptidase I n=1 Tax=Rarobacter incanus TaxID=153494 RepID=A0A542SLB4_9MICO|nr:signal peptidase I [Rarobacter incanus]
MIDSAADNQDGGSSPSSHSDDNGAGKAARTPWGRAFDRWRSEHPQAGHVIDFAVVVVIALVLSFIIKTFLVQPFVIPSESMEDTFLEGDRVVVSKLSTSVSHVRRGDIIVFRDTDGWLTESNEPTSNPVRKGLEMVGLLPETGTQYLIKRIIGVGGDRVVCCTDDGRVSVNGTAISETYLKPGSIPSEKEFDVTVPQGKLWVMGDNRQHSGDSRYHMGDAGGGFVDDDQVVGTAFATVWPLNRLSWHTNPESVFGTVDAQSAAK